MNKNEIEEIGERASAFLVFENNGTQIKRKAFLVDRIVNEKIQYMLDTEPLPRCDFSNKYGLCKLDKGHGGGHTVIFLGDDEE